MFSIAKHLALNGVTKEIGLDRCRMAASGGVPCKKNVLKFFQGLDIQILESYGMTECCECLKKTFHFAKFHQLIYLIS